LIEVVLSAIKNSLVVSLVEAWAAAVEAVEADMAATHMLKHKEVVTEVEPIKVTEAREEVGKPWVALLQEIPNNLLKSSIRSSVREELLVSSA
jgi:hypothetical protein